MAIDRNSFRLALVALSVSTALGLAGCATEEPPEGGVRIDQQNNIHPALNSVRVIDDNLARNVSATKISTVLDVEGTFVSTTPTGFKKITVQLRNKSNVSIPIEVRNSWYDANGVPVDSAQSWTHMFLQPQSMVTYEQSASKLTSAQYYVEVRGAK